MDWDEKRLTKSVYNAVFLLEQSEVGPCLRGDANIVPYDSVWESNASSPRIAGRNGRVHGTGMDTRAEGRSEVSTGSE